MLAKIARGLNAKSPAQGCQTKAMSPQIIKV
jgi:hypothetical protein